MVLQLVPRSGDLNTVRMLRALLTRAEAGDIAGIALSFRLRDGTEDAIYTGIYKVRPAEAVQAAMTISWRLTQLNDEVRGTPQ